MKTRIWMLLMFVAVCAMPAFGQVRLEEDETEPVSQRCIDCDAGGGGGGWYDDSSYDQGQYMDNPCTYWQDWVWVNYTAYAQAQKDAVQDQYFVNENTTMGGVYAASGSAQADVGYNNTFTVRNYHKVNTSDNFHVVTVVTVNPSTRTTTLGVETACGNGMPDSAQ